MKVIHVFPEDEREYHILDSGCECYPDIFIVNDELAICVHNSLIESNDKILKSIKEII